MQKKEIQTKLLQQIDPRKGGNTCLRTFGADLSILLKRQYLNKQANAATRLTSHFRRERMIIPFASLIRALRHFSSGIRILFALCVLIGEDVAARPAQPASLASYDYCASSFRSTPQRLFAADWQA
jgi:hypothetical protein